MARTQSGNQPWSETDLRALRALYSNTNNVELGALLGRTVRAISVQAVKLGLRKSKPFMDQHLTRFKPGQRPHTWVPIGSHRLDKTGTLQRKVSDDPGGPHKRWRSVHEPVWVEHHGPVPKGHVVVFRPGRKQTDPALITIDCIECVSRAELMRRNSCWTNLPPELARLVQLRGALNRQINKATRKQS